MCLDILLSARSLHVSPIIRVFARVGRGDRPACLPIHSCFPSVLFPRLLRRAGQWGQCRGAGEWERGRSQVLRPLQLLPGPLRPACPPRAAPLLPLVQAACPSLWLWRSYRVLSLQPRAEAAPGAGQPLGGFSISCWPLGPSLIPVSVPSIQCPLLERLSVVSLF